MLNALLSINLESETKSSQVYVQESYKKDYKKVEYDGNRNIRHLRK